MRCHQRLGRIFFSGWVCCRQSLSWIFGNPAEIGLEMASEMLPSAMGIIIKGTKYQKLGNFG